MTTSAPAPRGMFMASSICSHRPRRTGPPRPHHRPNSRRSENRASIGPLLDTPLDGTRLAVVVARLGAGPVAVVGLVDANGAVHAEHELRASHEPAACKRRGFFLIVSGWHWRASQ